MKKMHISKKLFNHISKLGFITCVSLSTLWSTAAHAKVNPQAADQFFMVINNHKVQLGDSLADVEQSLGAAHDKSVDKKTNSEKLSWWFDNGLTLVTVFKEVKNSHKDMHKYEQFKPLTPRTKPQIQTVSPEVIDILGYGNQNKTVEQLEEEINKVIADRKAIKEKIDASKKELKKIAPHKALSEIIISSSSKIPSSYLIAYGERVNLNTKNIGQLETKFNDTYRCLSYYEQGKLGWVDFTVRDGKGKHYYANFSTINTSKYSLTDIEGLLDTKQKQVDSLSLSQGLESHSTKVYCKDWYER